MRIRMLSRDVVALLSIVGSSLICLQAQADCAANATIEDTKRRYATAQQHERAGKMRAALFAYAAAQEYTCEPNPVADPAAKRAAQIAPPLGQEAEQRNDFQGAYEIYEKGGHYAASDRALMAFVRTQPDDPSTFARAREVLTYRSSPVFQNNNKEQLAIAGAYRFDQKHLDELLRMPGTGVERALQAEMSAWQEQYLRDFANRIQTLPDDPMDTAGMQRYEKSTLAFIQKWPQDPLQQSRKAIDLATQWANVSNDATLQQKTQAQCLQRIEMRIGTLTKAYHGAPELLEAAIEYQTMPNVDAAVRELKAQSIRAQAGQLGDQAAARDHLMLASEYYRVARLDDKRKAAQAQVQQAVKAKLQPSFEQAQQQAAELQKAFSDPEKIKQMQQQAQQMQKAIQAQQQTNTKANAKKAEDLEKELGL